MNAIVWKGQLVYVDTEKGQIQIVDEADGRVITLNIDASTKLPRYENWEDLMASDIEAVVVDGKIKTIYLVVEDE